MNFISNVLVPIDLSETSINVLNYSIKIVKKYHAKLTIVHVVPHFQNAGFHADSRIGVSNLQNELAAVKNSLDGLWRSTGENGIEADLVLVYGDPFTEIMNFAKSKKNDIIVMGTHGRTGLAHLLRGSVAEKIVRYSHIPVVTVKHESYECFPKAGYEYDVDKMY